MARDGSACGRYWVGGATGFLGSHVVRALRSRGHEVVAVSRSGGRVDDVEVRSVDALDADAVRRSAEGCDGAFVAVGKVSRDKSAADELHRVHVLATRSVLAGLSAARVPRAVVASTSGTIAVGSDPKHIADESEHAPLEIVAGLPYYRSKLYAEREALEAHRPPEFEVVIVNPSLLLGPGDLRESSTGDVRRFLERSIPAIPAGGVAFVDVRDAAQGMVLAFERGLGGQRYILNAANMSVAAFFQRLERVSGVRGPRIPLPRSRALALGINDVFSRAVRAIGGEPPIDPGSVELGQYFWYASSALAERELGWAPRDPGETLRDTVDDLIARKAAFPKKDRSATPSLA